MSFRTTLFTFPFFLSMGFFDLFKNAPEAPQTEPKTNIMGMVLLETAVPPDLSKITEALDTHWQITAEGAESGKEAAILTIDDYTVAIAYMPFRIPGDEVAKSAAYNYYWENGEQEAPMHKAHIVVSVINAGNDPLSENLLFTKIADAVLRSTPSTGIYIGDRTLVLKKDFYLSNAEGMQEGDLPIMNWVYFGLRQERGRQSIYTYGMKDFGKQEMEILNSKHSFEELHAMLYNVAHYVISSDVTLKHGETIGITATQKLKIALSKGQYLEGETVKISY